MIKIAVVDNHQFVHDSLSLLFKNSSSKNRMVLNELCPDEFIRKVKTTDVDVLIIDVNLPLAKGVNACKKIHQMFPDIKILVFSPSDDMCLIAELFEMGINCYLSKAEGFDALQLAINDVANIGYHYRYDIAEIMRVRAKKGVINSKKKGLAAPTFTEKELTIIRLARLQYTNKQIAEKLGLNIKTIEMRKRAMLEKTNCKKIIGVIDYLVSNKILPLKAS